MASPMAERLKKQMIRLKPIITNSSIKTSRKAQDRLGKFASTVQQEKVSFYNVPFENFQACLITPVESAYDDRVILYLHGGGYTAGSIEYAKGFGCVLASAAGVSVLCAAYRLAPENPFPAAVEDAYAAYCYLLEHGKRAENIIFCGESAGGGLIYALALKLRQEGMALPAGFIALSPWTDLTLSGETHTENRDADPSLSTESLKHFADCYAPGEEANPLVSPIFGDLTGFPPSLIYVGGDEILRSDSEMLASKLEEGGARCELHIEAGLWHVYVLYPMPESEQAMARIVSFIGEICL